MAGNFIREGGFGDRKTLHKGKRTCEGRGRYWSDETTSQGIASNRQKLGRGQEEFFSRTFRESMGLATP